MSKKKEVPLASPDPKLERARLQAEQNEARYLEYLLTLNPHDQEIVDAEMKRRLEVKP